MNETTTYTEQQIDDWASIFGACAEMWSWWHRIEHTTGDWDTPGFVVLSIENPSDAMRTVTKTLEPYQIFAALAKATELYPWHFTRNYGELDLDASSADLVLQVAVLGDAIYG